MKSKKVQKPHVTLTNVVISNSKIAIVGVNTSIRSTKLHLLNNETGIELTNSVIDMEDTKIE